MSGLIDDYLQSKKQLWALTHDITAKGLPNYKITEIPSERGQGVYSLPLIDGCKNQNVLASTPTPELANKGRISPSKSIHLLTLKSDDIDFYLDKLKRRLKIMQSNCHRKRVKMHQRTCLQWLQESVSWIEWTKLSETIRGQRTLTKINSNKRNTLRQFFSFPTCLRHRP